jgi:hypothetical protein
MVVAFLKRISNLTVKSIFKMIQNQRTSFNGERETQNEDNDER